MFYFVLVCRIKSQYNTLVCGCNVTKVENSRGMKTFARHRRAQDLCETSFLTSWNFRSMHLVERHSKSLGILLLVPARIEIILQIVSSRPLDPLSVDA